MSKIQDQSAINVPQGYILVKEIINLKELEEKFGFSGQTIKRERYLQKQIQSGKNIKGQRYNANGLGFKLQPIQYTNNGELHYYTKDVIQYIEDNQQLSPEENLKAGAA